MTVKNPVDSWKKRFQETICRRAGRRWESWNGNDLCSISKFKAKPRVSLVQGWLSLSRNLWWGLEIRSKVSDVRTWCDVKIKWSSLIFTWHLTPSEDVPQTLPSQLYFSLLEKRGGWTSGKQCILFMEIQLGSEETKHLLKSLYLLKTPLAIRSWETHNQKRWEALE